MVYINASQLSSDDIHHLGENIEHAIRQDQDELSAINRSLACHDEELELVS